MTIVMSIVADFPKGSLPGTSDGNTAINDTVKRMQDAMNGGTLKEYQPVLERAVYVRDIALILRDAVPKPDIIQIIGHGSPGRVELGSYWTTPLDPNKGPAVLDSNPDSYGMLLEVLPRTSKVFLLGCNVGSAAPSGYAASGRALLFDIEDMTGANVYAADDLVYSELFKDGFLYTGSLVTSTGKPANPASLLPRWIDRTDPNTDVRVPPLHELLSAPAFGTRAISTAIPPDADYFRGYVRAGRPPAGLLAMTELVFSADNCVRVEAICCLRYLRAVTKDGNTEYFQPPPRIEPLRPGVTPQNAHFDAAKPTLDKLRDAMLRAAAKA